MFSFLKCVSSTIKKVFCVQAASEQNTPKWSNSINSTMSRSPFQENGSILKYANGKEESIFCENWREFMRYPVLYELSLNCGLPEKHVWNHLQGLLNEIENEIRLKTDAEKILQEVTNSFVLRNVVFFLKRRNDRLAELKLMLHELECEILKNLSKQNQYIKNNELGSLLVSGTLKVQLIGCVGLLAAVGGGNIFRPEERHQRMSPGADIKAVFKLDNIKVAETPWRPYSSSAWNYFCSIDMCYSRILEIDILWRDLRSLCGVKIFRLEPFIDGKLHRMALQLEPQGCLYAEFQFISRKCNGN